MFHAREQVMISAMSEERHIAVTRTARYYILGKPGPDIDEVWFVCHGYGQLAKDFIKEFECIDRPRRLIVAPEALSRYYISTAAEFHGPDSKVGATWMTREDRETEIDDYVNYLDDLYAEIMGDIGHRNVAVTVLGFSQGGATANRWLTRGSARADRLLMWGALLSSDSDLNEAAAFFRDTSLVFVYGTRDQYAEEGMIPNYEKLLESHSIPFSVVSFNGGHRMDRDTLKSLATTL
jgi:predicted esterase